jgi:hypothetical protein
MLAVVKNPPIEFSMQGEIPEKYLNLLKEDFGPALYIFEDEEPVPAVELDWYR